MQLSHPTCRHAQPSRDLTGKQAHAASRPCRGATGRLTPRQGVLVRCQSPQDPPSPITDNTGGDAEAPPYMTMTMAPVEVPPPEESSIPTPQPVGWASYDEPPPPPLDNLSPTASMDDGQPGTAVSSAEPQQQPPRLPYMPSGAPETAVSALQQQVTKVVCGQACAVTCAAT